MNKSFKLEIIGDVSKNGVLKVKKDFLKGLKYIENFSHLILIYSDELYILKERVFKIKNIDSKLGYIKLEGLENKELLVYDIKPYFPSEDNIKDFNFNPNLFENISNIKNLSIEQKGLILKENGKYKLKIENNDFLNSFEINSFIKIFWWFDRFDKVKYRKTLICNPPYENAPKTGVFASRSPVRPTPIALTIAKIIDIKKDEIYVTELECFDHTPLIGILPYNNNDSILNAKIPKWLSHWRDSIEENEYSDGKLNIINSYLEDTIFNYSNPKRKLELNKKNFYKKNSLKINGARHNNLKNIDVEIPYGTITSITGVSGSGKSSLAFDTVYSECRKRFLDASGENSLNDNSDFDSIEGIIPAIAISQNSLGQNIYSTVGTATGMINQLRILFSTIGIRHCPKCGNPVIPMTEDTIENILLNLDNYKIEDIYGKTHNDFRLALNIGKGVFYLILASDKKMVLQTNNTCSKCGKILFDISPSMFSYTNPESMCPVCNGKGEIYDVDVDSIIQNPEISILDGASKLWGKLRVFLKNPNHNWIRGQIIALANEMNIDLNLPWKDLPEEFKKQAIYGSNGRNVTLKFSNNKSGRNGNITRPVEGAYHIIKRLVSDEKASKSNIGYMKKIKCNYCDGERLNIEGRSVTINKIRYPEILSMSLKELKKWCESLYSTITDYQYDFISPILKKLIYDLNTCKELGLDYLSLDRSVTTLSGGELQRLKLVSQFGSNISGVLYVMDEPTAGLHPKDYEKLIKIIKNLKENSNTILLVEHNKTIIKSSDRIIDIGPKAGKDGGNIVLDGEINDILNNNNNVSETIEYIKNDKNLFIPKNKHKNINFIEFEDIKYNNLKNISIKIPLKSLTCITGVSGSGKSSLLEGVLFPTFNKNREINCKYTVREKFKKIILADQSPIGRTPRSVPATYIGIMDEIRNIFSEKNNINSSYFSFNSPDGQCDNCKGCGEIKIDFINTWSKCPVCDGKRYKKKILDFDFDGKNIFDILEMTIEEAFDFFHKNKNKKIYNVLNILMDVGLGYLKLGQNSATLSGGEAQRLKLAKELCKSSGKNDLYLLDEPTTGLHFSDIQNLLTLFRKLTDKGCTIIIIEHNPDVIKNADWVIDIGPESGEFGGEVIVQGTPKIVSENINSYTGKYLKVSSD
ncbi:TrmO family methyltransferase domain-containing protein [Oceanotoga teriensis]|uniref:TrmO family methyltransferase domain-containing protein n=1 Tax=Oceanotoga teriensis TaxID=515440 RepID=UPI002712F27A|nr:TrmO family methyltransferase [Oceanotoga teriensis]MDO7976791.1 TrmO family methyltransferase [Oceanotoga teriensis]